MKKIILVLIMLVSLNVYSEGIEDKIENGNTQRDYQIDTDYFNKYLNYDNFKTEFNRIYGERTGVSITMIIDELIDSDNLSDHGYKMYIVSNRTRISDDIKYISPKDNKLNSIQFSDKNINYFLNTYTNSDIRVVNNSNVSEIYAAKRINTKILPEIAKNDILFIQAAGNEQSDYDNYTQYLNNTTDDNLIVVAALVRNNILYGNSPVSDFSTLGTVYYNYNPVRLGTSGTSTATMVTSTIITQYYTIRPCWTYKNMVKFIYSILRPTSELGIIDDKTKTKSYLTYDTRIFDDKYVTELGLPVCGGISSSDNSTNVLTDNATIMLLEKFKIK